MSVKNKIASKDYHWNHRNLKNEDYVDCKIVCFSKIWYDYFNICCNFVIRRAVDYGLDKQCLTLGLKVSKNLSTISSPLRKAEITLNYYRK